MTMTVDDPQARGLQEAMRPPLELYDFGDGVVSLQRPEHDSFLSYVIEMHMDKPAGPERLGRILAFEHGSKRGFMEQGMKALEAFETMAVPYCLNDGKLPPIVEE